jgi:hypothetical protein
MLLANCDNIVDDNGVYIVVEANNDMPSSSSSSINDDNNTRKIQDACKPGRNFALQSCVDIFAEYNRGGESGVSICDDDGNNMWLAFTQLIKSKVDGKHSFLSGEKNFFCLFSVQNSKQH